MRNPVTSTVARGLLALLVVLLFCGLAQAQVDRRTLNLKLGGSDILKTSHPFMRVSIADAEIADVVVLSPRELYVFGKKVGYTSVILWEEGRGRTLLDVVISLDLTGLKEKLHELYPDQEIYVHGTESGVVLTGTVSGPEVVEQVLRLASSFLPIEAEQGGGSGQGTGKSSSGITNLLKVGGIQQVMLEVKFAEVTRTSNKSWQAALGIGKLGQDFSGQAGVGAVSGPITLDAEDIVNPGSLLLNFAGNASNIFVNIDNVTAALEFLETEGLARTLAEPRLVAQSGQEASFLAGGEFPIPISQDEDTITIQFREFGVALVFTPVVLSDGKVSLRVAPSVSDIATTSTIPSGIEGANFVVPNLTTRKLETTVQLYDGQTLALAGLLQDSLRETVRKIPGLGDIPILGALFRSSSYNQEKTDLLVAVTPHIVKPNREGELRFPGEYMQPPNWFEFYLEGRMEGRRPADAPSALMQHRFAVAQEPEEQSGGMEGEFGHQELPQE